MDPSNPQILYFGTFRVYQTTDSATSWTAISSDLTEGSYYTITTIAVAPTDSKTVYAGTLDHMVWLTTNADQGPGATWTNRSAGLPLRSVTQITADPTNSQVAYVTFSGFSGFGDTQGHVFRTTNRGLRWTDISGTPPNALPNIPVNDMVVDPDLTGTLYVGTDAGVFGSSDGGANWSPVGTGLPRVLVLGLKLHRPTRTLRAASYGRGAWDLTLPSATSSTSTSTSSSSTVSTTTSPTTTTLTIAPCLNPRCVLQVALKSPECAGQSAPASVEKKVDGAAALCDLAPDSTPKKARRLRTHVKTLMGRAAQAAIRAAHRKKPQLSSGCGAKLGSALSEASSGLHC